eukprot:jgi/Psemu1/23330/gm1.23330_g
MPARIRRGRSPTPYQNATNADNFDDDASMMDEDDQLELVESLQREAISQTRFFQKLFCYGIGGIAIAISLAFPLLCPDECGADQETAMACWSHSVFSTAVHLRTVRPFASESPPSPSPTTTISRSAAAIRVQSAIDIVLQVGPIGLWWAGFFSTDEDHFHLALLIGNFVTFLGARLIQWDMQATQHALESLDASRYKHKSL